MGGNSMSALYQPIHDGDVESLRQTLDRFGPATPLILQKQFVSNPESGCIEIQPIYMTPCQFAISRNEPACLGELLKRGCDANERGKGGSTLLHRAVKRGSEECVQTLLTHGASVNNSDEWGLLPLHACAGAYGTDNLVVFNLILEAGVPEDINSTDEYLKTPLHYASYYGNKNIARRLFDLGADLEAVDASNRTPYQVAERQPAFQRLLLELGAVHYENAKRDPNKPEYPRQLPTRRQMPTATADYPRQHPEINQTQTADY